MLKSLLKKETCANCKICCGFDSTDIWEMPVMNDRTVKRLLELKPETKFRSCGDGRVTDAGKIKEGELFMCPALDPHNGCTLGDAKPFDCLIWPFRVMDMPDKRFRAITISPVCPEIYSRPLSELCKFVNGEFSENVFIYARQNPEIVKEYRAEYPILAMEEIHLI